MGGTLITLANQGHDVHIAYMTSGNIAVFDHDAERHTEYVSQFLELFELKDSATLQQLADIREQIGKKQSGGTDHDDVLAVKGLIRKTEAIAAAQEAGVPESRCHFLNLPFYRTGRGPQTADRHSGRANHSGIAEPTCPRSGLYGR